MRTVLLTIEEAWNKAKWFHLKTKQCMMIWREYPGTVKQVCLVLWTTVLLLVFLKASTNWSRKGQENREGICRCWCAASLKGDGVGGRPGGKLATVAGWKSRLKVKLAVGFGKRCARKMLVYSRVPECVRTGHNCISQLMKDAAVTALCISPLKHMWHGYQGPGFRICVYIR